MYIVFEGIDNSGKSTQMELVRERLELLIRKQGYDIDIITMAEPEIKNITNENDDVELALRFALQRRLLHSKYNPYIFYYNDPTIVLSDRSYYSSMAYQYGLNTSVQNDYVKNLNSFAPEPVMIFFFDNGEPDDDYLKKVRINYFNILPLSTIYVNTKKYSISETTSFIVSKVLGKWNELFKDENSPWRF